MRETLEFRMAVAAGKWQQAKRYSEDQPRDDHGRFGDGSGEKGTADTPHGGPSQKPPSGVTKSLGSNKDYKTWGRTIDWRLAAHKERMDELVSLGVSREAASTQAMQELGAGKLKAYGAKK